jgi:hypothetical protein
LETQKTWIFSGFSAAGDFAFLSLGQTGVDTMIGNDLFGKPPRLPEIDLPVAAPESR